MITAARIGGADFSKAEAQRSAAAGLIVTLVLTLVGVALDKTLGDNIMFMSLIYSSFFIGMMVSARDTYFRPYSQGARNMLLLLGAVAWYLFFLTIAAVAAAT